MKRLFWLSLVLAFCISATAAKPHVFPGKDWAKASPESQGLDPAMLQAAVDHLDRELKEYGGTGTAFIVRNGYAIWAGPECDRQYQIFSANGLHNNVCIVVPEWNMVVGAPTEDERAAGRTARLTWTRSGAASSPSWPRRFRRPRAFGADARRPRRQGPAGDEPRGLRAEEGAASPR